MIPAEGLAAMLDAVLSQPMMLCLYAKGPAPTSENVSDEQFDEPDHYEPAMLTRNDWVIDEAKAEAVTDKKVPLNFTGKAGKVVGWMLLRRADRTVIAFDAFPDPYPIQSSEDKLGVTPKISLARLRAIA